MIRTRRAPTCGLREPSYLEIIGMGLVLFLVFGAMIVAARLIGGDTGERLLKALERAS